MEQNYIIDAHKRAGQVGLAAMRSRLGNVIRSNVFYDGEQVATRGEYITDQLLKHLSEKDPAKLFFERLP